MRGVSVVPSELVAEATAALKIPTVMTLTTLADIRDLVEQHLPAECREHETWRHVVDQMNHVDIAAARRMRPAEANRHLPVNSKSLIELPTIGVHDHQS